MNMIFFKNNKYYDENGNELHYIATTDIDTAKELIELGYKQIKSKDGRWLFINTEVI